jgi:signal transduction histidine kinase
MTLEAARLKPVQLTVAAAAIALSYYVGVQLAIGLTFPPATTTSVLWPPNSILTAALLILPVRYWWVCFAGALPVHLALELGAGIPAQVVALLFVTNCLEAVLAAGGVRLLSDSPSELNTFRRVAVLIGAAGFAAPALSSFADAAVMHFMLGLPYWDVWRVRTFANILTELSVVPVVVLGVTALVRGVHLPPGRRLAEAGLLAIAILGSAVWVFGGGINVPAIPPTPSVLLLPFYFWAAVRFGVGAVSAALFATVFVASYETRIGHRPFEVLPPAESMMAVQVYLTVMGVPLMCIAGLLQERHRAESRLAARLSFEGLLTAISRNFVQQPLDAAFKQSLAQVAEFLAADYVGLLQQSSSHELHVEWQWHQTSAARLVGVKCVEMFPWTFGRVVSGATVVVDSIEAFPSHAVTDRASFLAAGLNSATILPLVTEGRVHGALSLIMARSGEKPSWDPQQLKLIAEAFANAAARRQAELAVERGRQKIASMARLSSMGELTASLAHQLSQPLSGIRNNAEAACRFIDSGRATPTQLRDIVVDIIADDERAGEIIRRVRELLGRSEWSPGPLDANALVQDVAGLVEGDAVLRNVSIEYDFAPGPIYVRGNRVDLEQVVLNVVTNAMDAVADRPVSERAVMICTRSRGDAVELIVRDRGAGLPAGFEDRIFEPFVTTKAAGMGMGLAVARSLVDNHGGGIRAANHPDGGVEVTISIPAAPAAAA